MSAADFPFDPRKLPGKPETLQVPDLSEAIEGWRAWIVDRKLPPFGLQPKLFSVSESDYFWTPRKTALAHCAYGCGPLEVPGETCGCGFYAARTVEHLLHELNYARYNVESGPVRVIGQVALWGKVIECSQGWRATRAYPIKLFVPFEARHLARPLQAAYGCKVGLKNWIETPFERS